MRGFSDVFFRRLVAFDPKNRFSVLLPVIFFVSVKMWEIFHNF